MCSSKAKVSTGVEINQAAVAKFNGRPVLQPTCNRVPNRPPTLERLNSLKKNAQKSLPSPPPPPPSTSPRPPALKRVSDPNSLNSCSEKINVVAPKTTIKAAAACLDRKKSESFKEFNSNSSAEASLTYSSSLLLDSPGSIAAVRREHMAFQHAQRKMRVAHYGRSKSAKFEPILLPVFPDSISEDIEDKRCSFITPNSDPIYVAYHDEEWGVPVHDDKLLFELLVLCGAQVGSDWTSILKKRQDFRNAFSDFDAEIVANITEKQMLSISTEYGIDISRVRGAVDNSKRILQIKKEFGSFDKYVWGFVNNKPISTQHKFGHKIQVKTSKSESISKDMVRRGFRLVGPTMVHSFMQAAGLTNDHLITCHRHLPCTLLAARHPLNQSSQS